MRSGFRITPVLVKTLIAILGGCTPTPPEQVRLDEARAAAQQWAETQLDARFEWFGVAGVLNDVDCSIETGVNAKQCNAFVARMSTEVAIIRSDARAKALADAAPAIESMAQVVASLSEADFATFRQEVGPPLKDGTYQPLSDVGQQKMARADEVLNRAFADVESKIGDQISARIEAVALELSADPSLQSP